MAKKIKKILIANRGEIAVRIIRACRELDIEAVAIYSEVDRKGLWVRMADQVLELTGFRGRKGYLDATAILALSLKTHADAIHPGYGFLSESSAFSFACQKAGVIFIGPSPHSMKITGDKVEARKLAKSLKIPILSGTEPLSNWNEAKRRAEKIGYPILLKAAAGGGGRGMRLLHSSAEMKSSFESASREARASFGDGSLYLEKYLARPRHVEIQILADHHGNAIHLGERECSIQRRYQKLIEESPSPALDSALRKKMGDCALRLIRETGYTSAGTVEFLLDENRNFYFLEVNARLQVEHPVTEMVTGIDIVQAQIRIAQGEQLPWKQDEIKLTGHAIEARINCENPGRDFLPSPGRISHLEIPGGPGTRVDSALYSGYEIPDEFDSLIAKLICWGETRQQAIRRLSRALGEFKIIGIPTTLPFSSQIVAHPKFQEEKLSTRFLVDHANALSPRLTEQEMEIAALVAAIEAHSKPRPFILTDERNRWAFEGRMENVMPVP